MANKKDIEIKKLSLNDVNDITTAILDSLFQKNEETGDINFAGQYSEIIRAFFELVFAFPDLKIHEIGLNKFFDRYCDGAFEEYLELMRKDRRVQYIENAVNDGIQMRLRYYNGRLIQNSLAKLINNLNNIVEQYSASIDGLETGDVKGFVQSFAEFAGKTDTDSLVSTILDKRKPPSKSRKSAKLTEVKNKSK